MMQCIIIRWDYCKINGLSISGIYFKSMNLFIFVWVALDNFCDVLSCLVAVADAGSDLRRR